MDVALRCVRLLLDFQTALGSSAGQAPRPYLSASPTPQASGPDLASVVRLGGLGAVAGALEVLDRVTRLGGPGQGAALRPLTSVLTAWRDGVRASVLADASARRMWELVDLAVTNAVGLLADGLLTPTGLADEDAFAHIDHLDYREWLAGHGAAPQTLDSGIVRGMYDLVFAYEQGDRARPRFAAGLGLQLAARMLFDFKGAIFWRMQAGMGEVVFAPLYQALVQRGVQVELFHRLDRVALDADGSSVAALHLTRQAELAPGVVGYDPLVRVDGLPCWPDRPLTEQLAADPGLDLESWTWAGPGREVVLRAGEHFDQAVLAVSVGMVPRVAGELVAASPRWAQMVDAVATVPTQAAQLWFDASEAELGWDGPPGVTLSGFGDTFDTWASMTHLLPREGWGPDSAPRSLAYLCSALPPGSPDATDEASDEAGGPGERAGDGVRATLRAFLDEEVGALWPGAAGPDGFRWELLHDPAGAVGVRRLDAQYVRANVDPSDRYVQSLPGTGRSRLAPGDTGFANLAVAGDWTACGLDAGCAEAATRSGVLAARAVLAAAGVGGVGPTGNEWALPAVTRVPPSARRRPPSTPPERPGRGRSGACRSTRARSPRAPPSWPGRGCRCWRWPRACCRGAPHGRPSRPRSCCRRCVPARRRRPRSGCTSPPGTCPHRQPPRWSGRRARPSRPTPSPWRRRPRPAWRPTDRWSCGCA